MGDAGTGPAGQPEPAEPAEAVRLRISDTDRERVAQILYTAAAEGRLTMAEMESRLDAALAARTVTDLVPITKDLPIPSHETAPAAELTARVSRDRASRRGGSRVSIAVLSLVQRIGEWVMPAHHLSVAFWGRTEIDLCSARLLEPHSAITAVAVMGAVEIFVPEDMAVRVQGVGLVGRFGGAVERGGRQPSGPLVRVRGLALWGAVLVTRRPGDGRAEPPQDRK